MVSITSRRIKLEVFIAKIFFILIACLLFLPFCILLVKFGFGAGFDFQELRWVLSNTILQALLSTALGISFSLIMCFGALGIKDKFGPSISQTVNFVFLLPSLLPPLFVVLFFLQTFHPFPFGLIGLVFVQGFILSGLFSLSLQKNILEKLSGLAQISRVLGASRWLFYRKSIGLLRRDFFSLFISGMAYCVSSFSIPLLIGGGKYTTLEVLIFEKIRLSQDWSQAAYLSLIQIALGFSMYILSNRLISDQREAQSLGFLNLHDRDLSLDSYLYSKLAMAFVGLLCFFLIGLSIYHFFGGLAIVLNHSEIRGDLMALVFPSIGVAFLTSFLALVFCFCLLYFQSESWLKSILMTYVTPSTAVLTFAWLMIFSNEPFILYSKYIVVLFILTVPSALRIFFWDKLSGIISQVEVARTLGANKTKVVSVILWPQMKMTICTMSSVVGVWVMGDYAVSRFMLSKTVTIAMLMDSLISSYRLEMAFGVGALLLILSGIYFLIFYVIGGGSFAKSKGS